MVDAELEGLLGDALYDGEGSSEEAEYLQAVTRFFLALRGTGLFLAPLDADLIFHWRTSGVPLTTVLRGMHRGAERLASKKQPLRTLRHLKRYVDQEARQGLEGSSARARGRRSPVRHRSLESGPAPRYDAVRTVLLEHQEGLERIRIDADAAGQTALSPVLIDAQASLRRLEAPESWGTSGPVAALLELGRRFYEASLAALPPDEQEALQREAQAALRGYGQEMSEASQAETLRELVVSFLRQRYRLFEPARLLALWDD